MSKAEIDALDALIKATVEATTPEELTIVDNQPEPDVRAPVPQVVNPRPTPTTK